MSTQLGNISKSLGKEYNISKSNMGGDKLLSSSYLRENTIIIDSKINENFCDNGSYSLFITDGDGKPVRLTYTIQPGNGLYVNPADTDIIRMVIDDSSIMADDGDELYVNKSNIIDNYTLTVDPAESSKSKRGRIEVVTANLVKGTNALYGICKDDSETKTTYIDPQYPGQIRVDTQRLDTVDDSSNRDGIVKHSSEMNRNIEAVDGKLRVLTDKLDTASVNNLGVIRTDNRTTQTDDRGILSVLTNGLEHSNSSSFGISKGDEITINTNNDGTLTVNTRYLSPARKDEYGVVMFDDYSIGISENNGQLEVKRFQEIESLLKYNNPEHDIFRADIEDLKNRVSKLETSAIQEVIEFLNPVGDAETTLPKPEFNFESGVNHYTDRKTISFTIKSNCKFNLNVEYKNGTNDYSQVELINVRYGGGDIIPANQLSNTIFDETENTVKTIYLTFAVKNYDANNNIASINTQVIVSAACINNSSIKQTQFHIFKCWNNIAFTEDSVLPPEPEEQHLTPNSYLVAHTGTEYLQIYGNKDKIVKVGHNQTTSNNFFFNTYVSATYTYYADDNWYSENKLINLSSIISNNQNNDECSYNIYVKYRTCNYNGIVGNLSDSCDWLNTSISATYNTTKQFNVLTVKSTKPITTNFRGAYISCYLTSLKYDKIENNILEYKTSYTEIINKLNNFNNLSNITSTIPSVSIDDSIDRKLERLRTFENVKNEISNDEIFTINQSYITNVKKTVTNISNADNDKFYKNIIDNDIKEYSTLKASLDSNFDSIPNSSIDKDKYITYITYVEKLNKYIDKIVESRINIENILRNTKGELSNININKDSYITFFYGEQMDLVQPVITVTSTIVNDDRRVKFTVSRNDNALLKDTSWSVSISYNFINKNGTLVNADGNGGNLINYPAKLYPGTQSTYNYSLAVGTTTIQEIPEYSYYNVITVNGDIEDNGSFIGIGNKDAGIIRWGGYNKKEDKDVKSISDHVYAVFKLTGQNAVYELFGQQYSFYSIDLKDKSNYYKENLVFSDELEFVGLSKTPYNHSKTASYKQELTIGTNVYIVDKSNKPSTTTLNTNAKTYANNHLNSIKYEVNNSNYISDNNIVGIKIKSVNISDGAFYSTPVVSFSSTGVWQTSNTNNQSNSNNQIVNFGNAKISALNIERWDDYEMIINFTIIGSNLTNIPKNTLITSLNGSSYGKNNIIFIQNSKSYEYTQFYSRIEITSTNWVDNSCVVKFKLYNEYSLSSTLGYSYKETLYSKSKNKLETVYTDKEILYNLKSNRNNTHNNVPLLQNITGIKFWLGLTVNGSNYKVEKDFVSSFTSNGSVLTFTTDYKTGYAKSISIVNAHYANSSSSSSGSIGGYSNGYSGQYGSTNYSGYYGNI